MSIVLENIHAFPDVHFRYLIRPQEKLPSSYILLGFKQDAIDQMFRSGKLAARDAVLKGEGEHFRTVASQSVPEAMREAYEERNWKRWKDEQSGLF